MEKLRIKGKRSELLEYTLIILLIVSGNLLDISDLFVDAPLEIFNSQQSLCRELRLLGFALLAFKHISYDHIKLKALTFMFCIWSAVIIIYNQTLPDIHPGFLSFALYSLYLWWLIRIWYIKPEEKIDYTKEQLKLYERSGVAFNIMLPVKTFRGLLQILLVPWRNPLYETRVLIAGHKITGVSNNKFIQRPYFTEYIDAITKSGYRIRFCSDYKKAEVDRLIGKKSILGIRDCRRLEV